MRWRRIADIVKIQPPTDTDGISYLPTLLGHDQRQARHDYLFWDFAGYGGQLAVRMGQWKGVKRGLQQDANAPLELYDLTTDIGERRNLAAEQPELVARLEQIMIEAQHHTATGKMALWTIQKIVLTSDPFLARR